MKKLALAFLLCLMSSQTVEAAEATHGMALHGAPKYSADFRHFDYVNPNAPKGGEVRLSDVGTFDNLNPFILKGLAAAEVGSTFSTLMEKSLDEPFSQYGLIAESVTVAPDRSWVAYKLRPEARFHDSTPVTPDDVIFSFEILRDKGHPFYRSYYKGVAKAEKIGDREVKFTFKDHGNTELPLIMGELPVLPKHAWKDRDFAQTTLEPLIGSGPYKIETFDQGRSITYRRLADWWGKDLPINRGRYNYDVIHVDYYRDPTVELEAFTAGRYDFRLERSAKNWATAYHVPAVQQGLIKKEEIKNENPSGMQGFVFNLRRPLFQDRRVREALTNAFDFEWANKNLAYGAYTRTRSYFDNSELAATGLPSPEELMILEPYRGRIPEEVFTKEYQPPKTDGTGNLRANLHRAMALLKEAGWDMKNGKLVNSATGKPFTFEIVSQDPLFDRWVQPFLRNLERLGIKANFRLVDSAQYQNMMDGFDFDMTVHVFGASLSPGNEQRDLWESGKADVKGSRNLAGLKDPVVDDLVERVIKAPDRQSLITATRALDRVLQWQMLAIPHWHIGSYRVAVWDKFGHPALAPKYGLGVMDNWWIDQTKEENILAAQKRK